MQKASLRCPRSACTFVQSDQDQCCSFTESVYVSVEGKDTERNVSMCRAIYMYLLQEDAFLARCDSLFSAGTRKAM